MSHVEMQAREEVLMAAHRLLSGRIDDRGPGPHDDAEAEYSEDMLLAAAGKLVRAKLIDGLADGEQPISREEELLRRLAAAFATRATLARQLDEDELDKLPEDGPLSQLTSFLSALDHALAGTAGCLEPDEWEVGRRANAIAYLNASIAELPPEPDSDRKIVGVCPMGCGETLFLGAAGHITCSYAGCPDPTAAGGLLSQAASAQRTEEAVTSASERFKVEAELDAMRKHVAILLRSLKGAWWLDAAMAYQGLHRMINPSQDTEQIAAADTPGGST
jgi:Family of unknown function (DUF6085)